MSLLNKWFSRPLTTGRSRTNSPVSPLERLEPRLALAGDVARPLLEPAAVLYLDSTMFGPEPVVMTKSQVVGHDENSFVISHVPTGSVVEKLDAEMNTWVDVSTKPTSSNPRELLRLLQRRLIKHGEKIRWVTESNQGGELTEAFRLISWDDGSESVPQTGTEPKAVKNLQAATTTIGGTIHVSWKSPDSSPYHYVINVTGNTDNGIINRNFKTQKTSFDIKELPLPKAPGYTISVQTNSGSQAGSKATKTLKIPSYNILLTPQSLNSSCQNMFNGNKYWEEYSHGKDLPHSTISSNGLRKANGVPMSINEAEKLVDDYLDYAKNKPLYKFGPTHGGKQSSFNFVERDNLYLADYDSKAIDNVLRYLKAKNENHSTFTTHKHFTIGYKHQYSKQHAEKFVNENCIKGKQMYLTIIDRSTGEWKYSKQLKA